MSPKSSVEPSDKPSGKNSHTFVSPKLEEVKERCLEIGLPESEAQRFIDYHDAGGWMRGKTKITKWRSALATWKTNFLRFNPLSVPATGEKRKLTSAEIGRKYNVG